MFENTPKQIVKSPIINNNHPDLDISELMDDNWTQKHQSIIGALQWDVTIVRFDFKTSIITLSLFMVASRRRNLYRIKRIYDYLTNMKYATIHICTDEPDPYTILLKSMIGRRLFTKISGKSSQKMILHHVVNTL